MNIVIILASGLGRRMKRDKNKVFLTINRKPIIWYAVEAFERSKKIDSIIITSKQGDLKSMQELVKKYKWKKVRGIIKGGRERQDSAYAGLKFAFQKKSLKKDDVLIFHNGANPFVTSAEINAVIEAAKNYGAAAVAHPTKDTIKEVNEKMEVKQTLDRSKLWNMQTPQAIIAPLALRAFEWAEKEKFIGTDDISLVEKIGKKTVVVLASENNFKITNPLDLALAKIIIKKQKDV